MTANESWARVVLGWADSELVMTVAGEGVPDLSVVDDLARLQLAVKRAGGRMRLEEVAPALVRLLELAGLLREVGGQAESGEDLLDVQE